MPGEWNLERVESISQALKSVGAEVNSYDFNSPENGVTINPPMRSFPTNGPGLKAQPLLHSGLVKHRRKLSIRLMRKSWKLPNHLFLWPHPTAFPSEYFAATQTPEILPLDEPWLPDWLSFLWIGHEIETRPGYIRAWLYPKGGPWQLFEVPKT